LPVGLRRAEQDGDGSVADDIVGHAAEEGAADRAVGVLLVRLGGYAAGVFTGITAAGVMRSANGR